MFDLINVEAIPAEISQLMQELQNWTIRDIARRIRQYDMFTPTAEYRLHLLSDLSMFDTDLKKEIQRILGLTDKQINSLYKEAAQSKFLYDKRAFQAHGIQPIPFEQNYVLQRLVENISSQTKGTMLNITQSMGFATKEAGVTVFKPPAQFYQQQLDLATMKVSTGIESLDQSIKQSVKTMVTSGLRTVDYATGHQDRIDVAARRAVFMGLSDLTNKQSEYNSQLTQSTVYEISWHGGYRPSHAWGGRRFDTAGILYPTEIELYEKFSAPDGKIGTLDDFNCYHLKYSVFPDTPPTYTDHQLDKMHEEQQEIKVFEGKGYNSYQARQQQRAIERAMRLSRSIIAGYEGGELPAEDLQEAKILYKQQRKMYKEFSEAMGLRTEFNRVYTGTV